MSQNFCVKYKNSAVHPPPCPVPSQRGGMGQGGGRLGMLNNVKSINYREKATFRCKKISIVRRNSG